MNRLMDTLERGSDDSLKEKLINDRQDILRAGSVLGILNVTPEDFMRNMAVPENLDLEKIERMINERSRARLEKNWAKADELREKLKDIGVVLEDGSKGTTWRFDV